MRQRQLAFRALALCIAIACARLLAGCGHDDSGQPGGAGHTVQWSRTYGTVGFEEATSVQLTADGGYVVAVNGIPPRLLKLDASGNVVWQKAYTSTAGFSVLAMQATADGGYLMAGGMGGDAWVMKVDALGNILWQRMYELLIWPSGGPGVFVQATADGGSVVAGGYYEGWVLKLDADGNVTWQRGYRGPGLVYVKTMLPAADHGYVLAGEVTADISGHSVPDAWIMKLDAGGNIIWQRTYGGAGEDSANDVRPTADGGYIVVGETSSFNMYPGAAWVLKLDASGNVLWQKAYGGAGRASSVRVTVDGGYIVAGNTTSFGAGSSDAWVFKLDGGGNVLWQKTYGGALTDSAGSVQLTADGGYVVIGETQSFGAGGFDAWMLKLDATGGIAWCANVGTSNSTSVDTDASLGNSAVIVDGINVTQRATAVMPDDSTAVSKQHC